MGAREGRGGGGGRPQFRQNYDGNQVQLPVSRQRERPAGARDVSCQGATERREGDQGQRHPAALLLFRRGEHLSVCYDVNALSDGSVLLWWGRWREGGRGQLVQVLLADARHCPGSKTLTEKSPVKLLWIHTEDAFCSRLARQAVMV